MGKRHKRLWSWFVSLLFADTLDPQIECWPRGGGKSTTLELGVAFIGSQPDPVRRLVLYVSEKQEQADKHVDAIATLLLRSGVSRALSEFGYSRGWKCSELRADNGFNVVALGLDVAVRGIKLEELRPDLIIFDDVDGQDDTARTTEKKIRAITNKILPAGSTNCCVLFAQNMISDTGIMYGLVKGTIDMLHTRNVGEVEPAVFDLEYEQVVTEEGKTVYKITAGTASWAGQDLATCERFINLFGLKSFKIECQHEVDDPDDIKLFKPWMFEDRLIEPSQCPALQWYRGWDTAIGEDQIHDNTATAKIAYDDYGNLFIRGCDEAKLNPAKLLEWCEPIIDREPTVYQIPEASNMGFGIFAYCRRKGGVWKNLVELQEVGKRQGDKRKRAATLASLANDRKVYIVKEGKYLELLAELYDFTGIKENREKDNLVDAVTTPMTFLKETTSEKKSSQPPNKHLEAIEREYAEEDELDY